MDYPVSIDVQQGQGYDLAFDVYRWYYVLPGAVQSQVISVQMNISLSIGLTQPEHVHVNPRPITRRHIVSFIQTYSKECT